MRRTMRKYKLLGFGVCFLSGHLAFHIIPKYVPVTLQGRVNSIAPHSSLDHHDASGLRSVASHKRPRPQLLVTQRLEADINDDAVAWEDGIELDSQGKVQLKCLLLPEAKALMERLGEKPDRAEVLFGWLYRDERLIQDVDESAAGDGRDRFRPLGKETRSKVRAVATADGGLRLEDVQLASDGTRKLVSVLTSGEGVGKKVETVIIPMLRGPQKQPRYTVCVSSQVGCAMNCQFCYTGRLGLMANLQAAQMVEQVLSAKRYLESVGDPVPVTGVVFMGMGEPFDNYDRVMRAVKILTDPRAGVRLRGSSVTVSTVGLVPEIERFCADPDNRASLAVSLHTVSGAVRDKVIPINRRYPLEQLSETLRRHFPGRSSALRKTETDGSSSYQEASERSSVLSAEEDNGRREGPPSHPSKSKSKRQEPRRKSRILAVEYTLLGGVNDSADDAERVADWLEGIRCVVNLITFNPHKGTPFRPASLETSKAFRRALLGRGLLCTVRDSRGDDGMAACGQLGGESMSGSRGRRPLPVAWSPAGGGGDGGAVPPVGSSRRSMS